MKTDWLDNINKNGFHIEKSYFNSDFISDLNLITNNILKFEKIFNLIGLGNQSKRNGTIFTSNLMFKNKIFVDLILKKNLLQLPDAFLGKYNLSEYKIVSSYNYQNFKNWWHLDYPYNLNQNLKKSNLGILIPLMNFNKHVGSTAFLPKSHLQDDFINNFDNEEINKNAQFLETEVGDIFLYDGKLLHTGSKNNTKSLRNLISIQFVEKHIQPSEDMKIQYYQLNFENNILQNIMSKYHTPGISNFGTNRNINHTIYWKILKYPYKIYTKIIKLKLFLHKLIYKLFT